MALFSWQKKQKEDGTEELAFSEEDQKRMDKAAKAAEELPAIKEKLSGLDKINEFIDAFKAEKEVEKQKLQKQQQQQQQTQTEEEFEELMLTDPKRAMNIALQPTQQALLTLRADNLRREIYEDTKKFRYYHGDIKSEVDKLIAGQPLTARNDPSVIENAYLTVVGRHHDEIMEGKLKDRFAASESSGRATASGSAGDSGTAEKKSVVITDDIRKIAKGLGFKPEDYAKMLDEEGIGYA
jgi:hypothetical protein